MNTESSHQSIFVSKQVFLVVPSLERQIDTADESHISADIK
jgi:hypothetical protein